MVPAWVLSSCVFAFGGPKGDQKCALRPRSGRFGGVPGTVAAYGPMSPQFSNWEVPPVVLLCRVLQRLCAVCTGFGVGLTAAEPLGSRYRHPLRIRSCMTSSSDGSAAKKYL